MMENPIISVIVCTYNQEKTIRKTLDSILAQETSYPFEIVIGEDFGADSTRAICEEYTKKYQNVFLVPQNKNLGIVHNYINSVNNSKGKYIMGCAGDDFWHNPHKIQLQVDYMETHDECVVCHTDYDLLHTKSGIVVRDHHKVKKMKISTGHIQKDIYAGKSNIVAVTMCIRKSMFDKYIPKDDFINLGFPREDWPMLIILSYYGTIDYLPVSTATYCVDHESLSNILDYEKLTNQHNADFRMTKYLVGMFPEELTIDEPFWNLWIYQKLMNVAYLKQDYSRAKEYAKSVKKRSVKTLCAKNYLLFYSYIWLKKIAFLRKNI